MSDRQLDSMERNLERNRERIAGLVDELSDKLQPGDLARQGLQSEPAQTAIKAAKETWKQNPVACGLAAAALGYVIYQGAMSYADLSRQKPKDGSHPRNEDPLGKTSPEDGSIGTTASASELSDDNTPLATPAIIHHRD